MLEPDPDKRPTIWQVNAAACRILGRPNMLPNVFVSSQQNIVVQCLLVSITKKFQFDVEFSSRKYFPIK